MEAQRKDNHVEDRLPCRPLRRIRCAEQFSLRARQRLENIEHGVPELGDFHRDSVQVRVGARLFSLKEQILTGFARGFHVHGAGPNLSHGLKKVLMLEQVLDALVCQVDEGRGHADSVADFHRKYIVLRVGDSCG